MSVIFKSVTIGNGHKKLFSREAGAPCFLKLSLRLQKRKPTLYRMGITTSSSCFIGAEQPCTVVTNFGSEGKTYALTECGGGSLSSFALFRFMRYYAIATNKLCKLNFRGFFHVPTYKSAAGL